MRLRLLLVALVVAGCVSAPPSPTPASSPSVAPSVEPTPTPLPTATPIPTPEPTPPPIPVDEALLADRFTVLVAGADASEYRQRIGVAEVNTDALMVISVSADKSRIAMLSLPRDTVDVPMPDGSVYHGKVNGIAQRFGIETLRGAMSNLLGVPIDRYIRVDMDDFGWMVDAVGGVDVDVGLHLADAHLHLNIYPGPAHMDGALALAYTRTRVDSDYGRAARQQQIVLALVQRWLDPGLLSLVGTIRLLASLETDIQLDEVTTLLAIGRASASAEVTRTVLKPPRFSLFVGIEPNSRRGWVMIPDLPEIRAYVRSLLAD